MIWKGRPPDEEQSICMTTRYVYVYGRPNGKLYHKEGCQYVAFPFDILGLQLMCSFRYYLGANLLHSQEQCIICHRHGNIGNIMSAYSKTIK